MAYVGKVLKFRAILTWPKCCTGSKNSSCTSKRFFASDQSAKKATDPPLKFSESAAFRPQREREYAARPRPSVAALSFWESMEIKGDSYHQLNSLVFMSSLAVFMIYFAVLREENDLDEELTKPLWERLPSTEEHVLHERIMLGKNKGEDVSEYEKRYNEILRQKREKQERALKQQ